MPIPPDPILRAALRWLELAPAAGEQHTRSLLTTNARYLDLTPTQYETALVWLRGTGLLARSWTSQENAAHRVFEEAVQLANWFDDADLLVREPDELPIDAVSAASSLGISPVVAFRRMRVLWGKVDTALREAVGAAGELALVRHLEEHLDHRFAVEHVSSESDSLGFDISVKGPAVELHLEVKSTTRLGRPSFYVSRNEFEVSNWDPCWLLIVAKLSKDLRLESLRCVDRSWIWANAPRDTGPTGRWESSRFTPPDWALIGGVPGLLDASPTVG